jgi:hypothetical protein
METSNVKERGKGIQRVLVSRPFSTAAVLDLNVNRGIGAMPVPFLSHLLPFLPRRGPVST